MTSNDNLLLLASFGLYVMLALVWPTVRLWRQTGAIAYVLPASDDAYGFVSTCMKVLIGVLFAYLIVQLAWPALPRHLGPLAALQSPGWRAAGWTALALALAWTLAAQAQMGASWRIGIDTSMPTPLVRRGLFTISRNPIFLGMRVALAAPVCIQPNALTLALFLSGDLVIQFQVRLEEAFLAQQHGQAYAQYCLAVRRWL